MKLRTKILLTILIALGYFLILQYTADGQERATGCVSQVKLLKWYRDANEAYFDDQLPHDTEIIWYNLRYKKAMGDTGCNEQGCIIRLDPYVNVAPATAQETEYHEMCHVATYGKEIDFHGPEFDKCIDMLYHKGAFKGLI